MNIKKLELAPPYPSKDNPTPTIMKIEYNAEFESAVEALEFFIKLNKLIQESNQK